MKKVIKYLLYIIGIVLLILLLVFLFFSIKWRIASSANMKLLGPEVTTISVDGMSFRDLNKNGRLDTYEDSRADTEDRVTDLISQMNIDEKAGMLFINMILSEPDGDLLEIPSLSNPFSMMLPTASQFLVRHKMNHFNILELPTAEGMVKWNNQIQKMAERTRLGIPVTIGTDPRHGKGMNIGAAIATRFISRWPSQLGLGAIGDSAVVREFGDIARQEYLAMGWRLALHPMADIATEPRWARTNGTFGEDGDLVTKLTKAYILGFQGDTLSNTSVACMTKHFSGGGPQEEGWDAHFSSGPGQVYPGDNFDYHMIPFTEGALKVHTAQIMPYYGIPKGQTSEEVGFAFNKEIITDLLRDSLGFDGVVCTDWAIVTDMSVKKASAWGVEHLPELERVEKIMNAGCDMMGGESRTDLALQLINEGRITEERLDISLRRILRDKFTLGLFDDPYLDPSNARKVGTPEFIKKGREAQRKSLVLLKNDNNVLPIKRTVKLYVQGMDIENLKAQSTFVDSPEEADMIVLKLETPYTPPKGNGFLERLFHQGRLDFPEKEKAQLLALINSKPTITVLTLERPTVAPDISAASRAVIADFECEDDIIMELIYGDFSPSGKLPIEMPSSMSAVENQYEDVPYDSKNPLFSFGHGLEY